VTRTQSKYIQIWFSKAGTHRWCWNFRRGTRRSQRHRCVPAFENQIWMYFDCVRVTEIEF